MGIGSQGRIFLYLIVALGITVDGFAANYYINQETGSNTNDGSIEHPWKTHDRVAMSDFLPGDIIVDPKLADVKAGDCHLTAGSPAIDMGTGVGLTHELFKHDRDGNPVPNGAGRDVGAYEFQK